MKKYIILFITIALLALGAGCGQEASESAESNTAIEAEVGTETENSESQNGSTGVNDGEGAEIIAKSGSSSSCQDTEDVINEVDKELDLLLDTINSMEDVTDEDLDN